MEKKELNVRDLSQEELKSILGGTTSNGTCPKCGSNNVNGTLSLPPIFHYRDCGHTWKLDDSSLTGCLTGCTENCKAGCRESNKK